MDLVFSNYPLINLRVVFKVRMIRIISIIINFVIPFTVRFFKFGKVT